MNPKNLALLNEGISAVRGGNKREGARILAQVVRAEPQADEPWFWLAAATDQPGEAKACLDRVLKINPHNGRARRALNALNATGGLMPPLEALIGENIQGGGEPSNAPTMRPLTTGELLGSSEPGPKPDLPPNPGSPSSPPSPYGVPAAPYDFNAPVGGGSVSPYGAPPQENVPNPPFGETPSWAPEGSTGTTGTMGGYVDPYGANPNAPAPAYSGQNFPPASQGGAGGLQFGQLDPNGPPVVQPGYEAQAGPKIYDPGSEIRRSLMGEPTPPGTVGPGGVAPVVGAVPAKKGFFLTRTQGLLILAGTALLLFLIVFLALQATSNPSPQAVVGVAATGTASTLLTQTAATTLTPGVIVSTAGAGVIPTRAGVAPTSVVTSPPTATGVPQVTIIAPLRTPTLPPGTSISPAVQRYLNEANNLVSQMAFVETQINALVIQPYKEGKFAPGTSIKKPYEVSYYTLVMGQLANQFRTLNPPTEASTLHEVGLDYASDIREVGILIDRFYDSGLVSNLADASGLLTKAGTDRARWNQVIQGGYPFKVNF